MQTKVIPIILVNYNNLHDTVECIDSINKSVEINPFIILVDNASENQEKVFLMKNMARNIHIILNNENLGFGRANNVGIKWANEHLKYDYLLLLNNDTVVEPDAITNLTKAFQVSSDIAITTGKIMYYHDPNVVWYGGGEINYKRGWPKITDFNQEATSKGANNSRFVTFASGCVMMFKRESLSKLKGFDEDFFMYAEDLELSLRVKKEGFKIFYTSKSVTIHKVQASVKKDQVKYTGMQAKNPNLPVLFYQMKTNQWMANKKSLPKEYFGWFKLLFWFELFYKVVFFIISGQTSILKTSIQIIKKIKANNIDET